MTPGTMSEVCPLLCCGVGKPVGVFVFVSFNLLRSITSPPLTCLSRQLRVFSCTKVNSQWEGTGLSSAWLLFNFQGPFHRRRYLKPRRVMATLRASPRHVAGANDASLDVRPYRSDLSASLLAMEPGLARTTNQ